MKGAHHMNKIAITAKKREIGKKRGKTSTHPNTSIHCSLLRSSLTSQRETININSCGGWPKWPGAVHSSPAALIPIQREWWGISIINTSGEWTAGRPRISCSPPVGVWRSLARKSTRFLCFTLICGARL